MKSTVIGTGYPGATHAAAMAELGHDVIGIDIDETKIARLSVGSVPFFEPGLPELLGKRVGSGRPRLTTSVAEAADADLYFICVGTPQKAGEFAADLSYVDAAFNALAKAAKAGSVAVGKSTVPVGTAARVANGLADRGNGTCVQSRVSAGGLRRPGHAQTGPDRHRVLGRRGARATRAGIPADHRHGRPCRGYRLPTAEVTVAANSYLATKMSFSNAMAEVCEATGADVTQLATAIGHDPRIGPLFLRSGLGFGGGCLPTDIRAFMARAGELDVDQPVAFLKNVDEINLRRRSGMVDLAREMCDGSLAGRRVAASAVDACRAADVVLHLTEGREFRELGPEDLGTVVGERNILDGRSVLDAKVWRSAGWTFRALGRP